MSRDFLHTIKENEGIIYKLVNIYAEKDNDQQDLYQEIVYQLWKSHQSFKGNSDISTWIYKVALNTSLTHIKLKKKYTENNAIQNVEFQVEDTLDIHQENKISEMYQLIRTLNEIDKAIIFLFLEGKNHQEIAIIIGLSVSNIGTRINRIKQNLKNKIVK
ncbi:MAG TPA: sigma-70 family RNA polymerase sigma factor [Saprospiraceae bacterium]|nr:sigma-70 family RNA polymerase sigma factor [Saprospiraceae bacterium]